MDGAAGVLADTGVIGVLLSGREGVQYWEARNTGMCRQFQRQSRSEPFLLATAKGLMAPSLWIPSQQTAVVIRVT